MKMEDNGLSISMLLHAFKRNSYEIQNISCQGRSEVTYEHEKDNETTMKTGHENTTMKTDMKTRMLKMTVKTPMKTTMKTHFFTDP
jgi:hypothetical protein